jgi:hypothetical protein
MQLVCSLDFHRMLADFSYLPLSMRKANLQRLLARRPDGIFVSDFEQGEIGPDLFRKACECALSSTARQLSVALTATPISTSCTPATTRPNRNLLTIVPNIGRKLPVIPVFFPDHNILAGHILWVWALGLQTEGPDLPCCRRAERLDVKSC